jgi:hypothetical protein
MKSIFAVMVLISLIVFTLFTPTHADVEWEWDLLKTFKIEGTPLDVAISKYGSWVLVLTENGEILIYSQDSTLNGRIFVGKSIDGIKPGPREDTLLLSSRKGKTIQIIAFDFIREINIAGCPYKGPSDAPIVIVVYSDFQ